MVDRQKQTPLELTINGEHHEVIVDNRRTVLDVLREDLSLTGTKKGCDRGQCGACTVLIDGQRALSCLRLAVTAAGAELTTVEGLATADGQMHPMQQAFIANDALQCGYCTPGQILSALGMADEADQAWPSHVTADVAADDITSSSLSRTEIAERMSGNLCRCAAYPRIVDAIEQALTEKGPK